MDGVQDILLQADKQNFFKPLAIEEGGAGYANWVSVLILSSEFFIVNIRFKRLIDEFNFI